MAAVSVLIPFRGDGQRRVLRDHCRTLWDRLPYEIVESSDGHDGGPFQIARAFNFAKERATGDYLILYGADHIPDPDRIEWAVEQLASHEWCALYAQTGGISRSNTNRILAGRDPYTIPPSQVAPFCTAIIGIRRDAWVRFDERFIGWGGEDTAWRLALETLYGPTPEPSGMLRCLWHEAASREHTDRNFALIGEYMNAQAEGRMREYLTDLGLL